MSIRNGKDPEIDPLATLFPPMAEEAFARLKADIAAASWSRSGPTAAGSSTAATVSAPAASWASSQWSASTTAMARSWTSWSPRTYTGGT